MTRQELLNILYAERDRVEKKYTFPGWTPWAIYAAIATLGWAAWDLINQGVDWYLVIIGFYAVDSLYFLCECIRSFFPKEKNIPVYKKSDAETTIGVVLYILIHIGLMIAQLMIIPKSFHPVLYWTAFVGLCVFLLLLGSQVVAKENGHTNFQSYIGALFLGPFYVPIAILLVMYLFQMGYTPDSYRLAVLFFAMYYLYTHIPSEGRKTLSKIDLLIHKVLYDSDEIDEKTILEELEVYIIGLRYGKHLSATRLKELKPLVNMLVNYTNGLIQDLHQGNSAGVDAIIKEGNRIYKDTKKQYDLLMWDVNSIYGEERDKEKSLEHIIAVGKITEQAMRFWSIAQTTMKLNYSYKTEHLMEAYRQTIGTIEIRQLIERELVGKEKELG